MMTQSTLSKVIPLADAYKWISFGSVIIAELVEAYERGKDELRRGSGEYQRRKLRRLQKTYVKAIRADEIILTSRLDELC